MLELTDHDYARLVIGDLELELQLIAIKEVLHRNREADEKLKKKIEELGEHALKLEGMASERAVDLQIDHLHASVYQDAAHSMAAVGMLAPFIEAVFVSAFHGIRREYFSNAVTGAHDRRRLSHDEFWDCHFVFGDRGRRKDLVRGIAQLADAIHLEPFLPQDYQDMLAALFHYRNKMFHFGFEWPKQEREKFQTTLANSGWPESWFEKSISDNMPWIFYMSDSFIGHSLAQIDAILGGIGKFAQEKMKHKSA